LFFVSFSFLFSPFSFFSSPVSSLSLSLSLFFRLIFLGRGQSPSPSFLRPNTTLPFLQQQPIFHALVIKNSMCNSCSALPIEHLGGMEYSLRSCTNAAHVRYWQLSTLVTQCIIMWRLLNR